MLHRHLFTRIPRVKRRNLIVHILLFFIFAAFLAANSAFAQNGPSVTCQLDISAAMQQFFGVPAQAVLHQAFWLGLSYPLAGYFVAYFVGLLVNMFNDKE